MEYQGSFDFFYGKESERLNFITIPKLLLKDERFKNISSEAKILYGCLLDRNSLSQKNGWVDEKNRVYVIYTVKEMQKDLCCATEKISRVLKELETIGLIFRKRNGRGKANYIYVMDYMAIYRKENGMRSPPVPDKNDCCGGIGQKGKNQSGACEAWDVKNFENRNLIRLNQVRLRKRILREISRRGIVGTTAIRAADRVRMLSAVLNSGIMILRRWNSFC